MPAYTRCARRWLIVGSLAWLAMASNTVAVVGNTIGAPVQIGTNSSPSLSEVSGLAASRANANTFWVHNDHGDTARFFAMSTEGDLLGTFPLDGATAVDWEDIAMSPKSGSGNYLYLGDIGDNDAVRPFITVYRTDEPTSTVGTTIPVGGYSPAKLQYPGGPRNAESLFVDPLTNDMFIITKTTIPEIYSVPSTAFDDPNQTTTVTALGNLGAPLRTATAADISPDGRFILIRSSKSSTGYLFEREIGQTVADALHGDGAPFALGPESQGEAIGWAADGASFYTTSELDGHSSAPIHSYAFTVPSATLAGDYNDDHVVDAADYTAWRDQMGTNTALPNEADTPGVVTTEDYTVWLAHFGESVNGGGEIAQSTGAFAEGVPEPANWLLAVVALLPIAVRRRS